MQRPQRASTLRCVESSAPLPVACGAGAPNSRSTLLVAIRKAAMAPSQVTQNIE
jgi:hypothetical protein